MAPKRMSIPIVVYAGRNVREYLACGMATVAAMVLWCPVCDARLVTHEWPKRIAQSKSKGFDPDPPRIRVRELVCPRCRDAGRHPRYFRVLPSFLRPFKHFIQLIRLTVFDRTWQAGQRPVAIEAATEVDSYNIFFYHVIPVFA